MKKNIIYESNKYHYLQNKMNLKFGGITAKLLFSSVVVFIFLIFDSYLSANAKLKNPVDQVAKLITVKVQGVTQGSGTLLKREGEIYTVLTAWHVLSGQSPGEELDIFTYDGKRHKAIGESIERVNNSDTALISFRSSHNYFLPDYAKRLDQAEEIYISGFPSSENLKFPRLVRARLVGITDCVSQVNKGGLLYEIQKSHMSSNNDFLSRFETPRKFITHPDSDTKIGMSGGPILSKNGSLIGHHNGGLGGVSDWGVAIKFGLNRGTILPLNEPSVNGYISGDAVCDVLNANESALKGIYNEAAKYSLSAYKIDKKSLPFVSYHLGTSLLKLGRIDLLCEIYLQGAPLNNVSLDYLCKNDL